NDDELADIMSEIESLEQEFNEETESEDIRASQNDAEHDKSEGQTKVVEQLAQKSSEDIQSAKNSAHDDQNVHSFKPKSDHSNDNQSWAPASMDFSIEGDMKMNMFFRISGKTVHLHVNEGSFEIELEGG